MRVTYLLAHPGCIHHQHPVLRVEPCSTSMQFTRCAAQPASKVPDLPLYVNRLCLARYDCISPANAHVGRDVGHKRAAVHSCTHALGNCSHAMSVADAETNSHWRATHPHQLDTQPHQLVCKGGVMQNSAGIRVPACSPVSITGVCATMLFGVHLNPLPRVNPGHLAPVSLWAPLLRTDRADAMPVSYSSMSFRSTLVEGNGTSSSLPNPRTTTPLLSASNLLPSPLIRVPGVGPLNLAHWAHGWHRHP